MHTVEARVNINVPGRAQGRPVWDIPDILNIPVLGRFSAAQLFSTRTLNPGFGGDDGGEA